MPRPSEPRRPGSPSACLAGLLAGWLAAVAPFALALAAALVVLNELRPLDLVPLFALWLAVYAAVALPGALLAGCVLLATRARGLSFARAAVVSAAAGLALLLCLNLLCRWGAASRLISGSPLLVPMGVLDLGVLALAFAALVIGAERLAPAAPGGGRRGRPLAWLASGAALLIAAHVANRLYERTARVDLATAVAPRIERDPACRPRAAPAPGLVLLGLDGMTWHVAAPLLAQGRMPNLERLLARSAYGHLDTLSPSYSPVVWATVATGLRESDHRVHGFLRMRVPGVSAPISRGPRLNAFQWWGGANHLLALLADLGWVAIEPLPSTQRRGLALWDVAAAHSHIVGVYDWMNSWPVEAVPGYMVASGGGETRNAHPEAEVAAVLAAVTAPGERPEGPLRSYERHYARALALFERWRPTVSLTFNKVMDGMHDEWAPPGALFARPLPLPHARFRAVIEAAYELSDRWIGRFLEATPPGYVFAVVSDHGYAFDGTRHAFSPPGVVVLSGGPFACARHLRGAHVEDVLPTLLATLSLPGLEAMPGEVLAEAFAGEVAARPPPLSSRSRGP